MTRRFSLLSLALTAVLAVAASACGRYLTTGAAVVNGVSISRDYVNDEIANLSLNPAFTTQYDLDDPAQLTDFERQLIVRAIQGELIRQGARTLKLSVTEAEIDARLQAYQQAQAEEIDAEIVRRGRVALDLFPEEPAEADLPEVQRVGLVELRKLLRDELLREKLAVATGGTVQPTEQELRVAYGNGQRFEEIKVRHILIQVQTDEAAARRDAQAALDRVREGEDFAAVARDVSQDSSAQAGGDLGYITREVNFDETFLNAAFALREGRVSDLVRTQFGFHIIKVDDRRAKTFEQARAELAEEITAQKQTESFQNFMVTRLRSADIVVNPRYGDFDRETFRIVDRDFFVPPSPEPETQPVPFQ